MPQNRPNPYYPTYSSEQYLDAASGRPTNDPGTADATSTTTAPAATGTGTTNVNIDPGASRQTAPAATTAPATAAPVVAEGPAGPGQPSVGGYTVAQIMAPTDAELNAANDNVSKLWGQIQTQQQAVSDATAQAATDPVAGQTKITAATSTLNALYNTYTGALARVETANTARATALNTAIHNGTIDPTAVKEAQSQANNYDAAAKLANTQADVLQNGADSQKALVSAQAGEASQRGLLESAQADLAKAQASKIPADIAQAQAQANALQAQADQTNTLIPGLKAKQDADTSLTVAQAGLTSSQSDLAKAQATHEQSSADLASAQATQIGAQTAAGLPGAQVAQAQGQAAQAQGAAAESAANVQKGLQGPLYGLQDQIKAIQAIQQQVFGPGGSGNPDDANDLLKQYTTATVSGTTPYAANVAAANAGLTAFGTQASLANEAQSAMASRANAYQGAGATALGSLLGAMKDAPKGFSGLGAAFGDVMNALGTGANQYAPPPTTPTAPTMPALLQKLAAGGQSAVQPAAGLPGGVSTNGPAPAPGGLPAGLPMPTGPTFNPTPSGSSTTAPVTINIGGQGQGQGASTGTPGGALPTGSGGASQSMVNNGLSMPAILQQHQPATLDYLHQLWGNELGSGAVQSPFGNTIGALG